MKNIIFFLCSILLLNACDSNSINSKTVDPIISPIETKDTSLSSNFNSICSTKNFERMSLRNELIAWGFEPLLPDNKRNCEKLNLNDFKQLKCNILYVITY